MTKNKKSELFIETQCSKGKKRKGKCRDFTCSSKADKISLVCHTNQTKKTKRAKQKKNRCAIKSGNGHKNPWDPFENV